MSVGIASLGRRSSALLFASVLAGGSIVPSPAEAAEPDETSETSETPQAEPRVEIVVSDEIEDAELIRTGLRRETDRQLEIQQVPRELDPSDPERIRVEITGVAFEYQITTDIERHGRLLRDARTVNCECSKTDLIDTALREVVTALHELQRAAANSSAQNAEAAPPTAPPSEPRDRPRRLTWMGGLGIGLVILGVGGVGAGAGLIALGDTDVDQGGNAQARTNLRPGGYAALGVGVAALAGGIALLVIDKKRLKEARKTTFVPYYDGTTAALTLTSRF